MNKVQQFFNTVLGHVASYAVHLALVAIAAVALHFGFHVSIPVIPGSLATWSVLGIARLAFSNLAKSWHSGRLQAELEADGSDAISQILAAAAGNAPASKADAAKVA
jgi:hypothetical protein